MSGQDTQENDKKPKDFVDYDDLIDSFIREKSLFAKKPIKTFNKASKDTLEDLEKKRYRVDTWLRIIFSSLVFVLVAFWIVSLNIAFLWGDSLLQYENSVIITYLTTTTAEVLGITAIVLRGLFGTPIFKKRSDK